MEHARETRGRKVSDEPLRLLLVRDDEKERPLEVARERGEQDRRKRPDAAGDDQALFSLANSPEEVRVGRQVASEVLEHGVRSEFFGISRTAALVPGLAEIPKNSDLTPPFGQRRLLSQALDGFDGRLGRVVHFLFRGPAPQAEADRGVREIGRHADPLRT